MDAAQRPAGTAADPVMAAGVLLWSGSPAAPRFLLLRNARHGAWGFAKGHAEPGEELSATALREVAEETGYALTAADLLPGFLDTHAYRPGDTHWKRAVHFLAAAPVDEAALAPSSEHAEHAWLPLDDALERLAHPELQRALVRAADALARA